MTGRYPSELHLAADYWARLKRGGKEEDPRARLLEAMERYEGAAEVQRAVSLGMVLLRYYIADNNMTVTGFGRLIGERVFDAKVKRWAAMGVVPNLSEAMAMDAATGGRVPAEAWLIGGPAAERAGQKAIYRRRRFAVIRASYIVKMEHLPSRQKLLRKLREWMKATLPPELQEYKRPKYKALKDWARVKGLVTDANSKLETTNEAPDFRFLTDDSGRAIPPEGYEARLEAASYKLAEEKRLRAEERIARRTAAYLRQHTEAERQNARNLVPEPWRGADRRRDRHRKRPRVEEAGPTGD